MRAIWLLLTITRCTKNYETSLMWLQGWLLEWIIPTELFINNVKSYH